MDKIGVLFDLDGVLIDSENLYTEFWREIDCVYPTGVEYFANVIKGNTLTKILTTYFPNQEIQEIIKLKLHKFEDEIRYPIFDGVIDFLEELKTNNIPTAIVTSSDDEKMNSLFKQHPKFKDYFNVIITGSIVVHSKPHPEGYLKAANAINRSSKDCFVFEDSIQGLCAGLASGATVIGLTTSNPIDRLKEKAHKLIDSFVGFTIQDMIEIQRAINKP